MTHRSPHTALLVLFLLAAAPLTASAASVATHQVVGHPSLHATVANNEVTAGTDATLDLYVQNDGVLLQGGAATYEQRVETARSTVLDVSAEGTPLVVHTSAYPAGDLAPGRNGPFGLHVTVPAGTPAGTYDLTVHASYQYTGEVSYDPGPARYNDFQGRTTFQVPVVVRKRAAFAVVGAETDVHVGQRGTYTVRVKNTGSAVARQVAAQVSSDTAGLTFGASGQRATTSVATWAPGQTKALTYDAAVAGTTDVHNYSVAVGISFDDADGVTRQANRLVATFRPEPEQTFHLTDLHSSLRIGRGDGTFSGTVVNDGPEPVHGATLAIQNKLSGVTFDQRSVALPDLGPGERAHFAFSGAAVSPQANLSAVPLALVVQYADSKDDRYASTTHQVTVPVASNADLFTITAPDAIPSGTRGDTPKDSDWSMLTLQVTNNGQQTLRNVRPSLVFTTQYYQRPIESNYRTGDVGTLHPGETKNVTFAVSASGSAGGTTYPLDVVVDYREPSGVTRTTTDYTVPIRIATSSSLPLLPIGGGAVVLAGLLIGGFIWWRRDPE